MNERLQQVLSNERRWHVETCDVLDGLRVLPDGCVQCCVTSPPYYALRDYQIAGQIGLEETPDAYIAKMVAVFREVRRVLRNDGCVFINIGDSYAGGGRGGNPEESKHRKQATNAGSLMPPMVKVNGIKPKDLMGIPWALAFALRADGWYLRSEIIWHKPNPMPESVTDRPSKAHEQIFLLSKSREYFYDAEAVKESAEYGFSPTPRMFDGVGDSKRNPERSAGRTFPGNGGNRNRRSVWTIPLNGFREAHFATFPHAIPETCLKAGTSLKGCCSVCGAPWERVTESERVPTRPGDGSKVHGANSRVNKSRDPAHESEYNGKVSAVVGNRDPQRHVTATKTTGWQPMCKCNAEIWPCLALDPFNGAGTTGLVASKGLGLRYIGLELNPEYADMARRRIERGFIDQPQPKLVALERTLF